MKIRRIAVGVIALAIGACGITDPSAGPRSIAGTYTLTSAQGVMLLGGTLTIGEADDPEDTVFTPGGAMPRQCVRLVPEGASVGLDGSVTLADGTAYHFHNCGQGTYLQGSYTLSVTQPVAVVGAGQAVATTTRSYGWDGATFVLFAGEQTVVGTVWGDVVSVHNATRTYEFKRAP